jgi:hypothetical protein
MMQEYQRWNYTSHQYDLVELPDDWRISLFSETAGQPANCPHCGETVEPGCGYTSLEFHSCWGFGYVVCEDCYRLELDRRLAEFTR